MRSALMLGAAMMILFQNCITSKQVISENDPLVLGTSPCSEPENENGNLGIQKTRAVIKRHFPKNLENIYGTIKFLIGVDSFGNVVYVKYLKEKSTIQNRKTVIDMMHAMKKTKFSKAQEGNRIECGEWTIKIKSNLL